MRSDSDEAFVVEHTALVRGMAAKVRAELNLDVELDDLAQYGFAGLLEARRRFEQGRGVPFTAFAHYRIRGAILDGVRHMAHVSRRTQERIRRLQALSRSMEGLQLARESSPARLEDVVTSALSHFDAATSAAAVAALAISEEPAPSPEDAVVTQFERARLRRALNKLPDREQAVLRALYFEERVLDDICVELRISSRATASRIHTRALAILRSALE